MIAQKTIQEIYDVAKVEDVIQDFMPLKRAGANMKGLCPFHNEKTSSFVVSPAKNIYKCFGCGKAGNPVTFVMEHERFSYIEAIRYLAQKYNIEIVEKEMTPQERAARQLNDSLFAVNDFAQEYYQNQLFETDRGKSIGLSYFKSRGYREETIKKFGLGFAPAGRDEFVKYAMSKGQKKEILKKMGLMTQYDRDFFRDRVMFTIKNLSGKPIAFAGRILQKDVKAPKYINSPETDIYNKSDTLYALYHAKQSISKLNECILVEGYTDVISLHQAGFENVVASSGTSLTKGQLKKIARYTSNLKFLYDGDKAGVKAAMRGLDLALEAKLDVKIALIPGDEDPDSFLQKLGATKFKEFIEIDAKDFIPFKTELFVNEAGNDSVKRSAAIRDVVSSISRVQDKIKQEEYIKYCSGVFNISEEALMAEMNRSVDELNKQSVLRKRASVKNQSTEISQKSPDPESKPKKDLIEDSPLQKDEFQEKDIVRVLIAGGDQWFDEEENKSVAQYVIENIEEVIDDFDNAGYQLIVNEVLRLLKAKKKVTTKHFVNHSDRKISQLAVTLITSRWEFSDGWAERDIFLQTQKMPDLNFSEDGDNALKRFKLRKIIKMYSQNQERVKAMNNDPDISKMMRLLKVQQKLLNMRDELAAELKIVVLR